MAKIYVEIVPVSVKADDSKTKDAIAKQIKEIFADKIESSGYLTCKRPTEKNAKGFSLDTNFVLTASGAEFKGQMNIAMSFLPKKAILGRAANGGGASSSREIEAMVEAVAEAIIAKVLPQLKAQIPKLGDQ